MTEFLSDRQYRNWCQNESVALEMLREHNIIRSEPPRKFESNVSKLHSLRSNICPSCIVLDGMGISIYISAISVGWLAVRGMRCSYVTGCPQSSWCEMFRCPLGVRGKGCSDVPSEFVVGMFRCPLRVRGRDVQMSPWSSW